MSNGEGSKKQVVKCNKCNGKGVLPYHKGIDNGRCFQCGGAGSFSVKVVAPTKAKPWCASGQLSLGDGSGRWLPAYTHENLRAADLAKVAALLSDPVANMAEIAARLAIINYPKATTRARAHFAGHEAAFDAAVSMYRDAIDSAPDKHLYE